MIKLHSKQLGSMGVLRVFLGVNQVLQAKGTTVIRLDKSKNNQSLGIHWFEEFIDFEKALRDHTQSTQPG